MSFAAYLTQVVADKRKEQSHRAEEAKKWEAFEALLLDGAVDLLKQRCTQAAEEQKSQVTVSLEVLSRDIPAFPRRILTDATYYVDELSLGSVTAECWFYSTNGTTTPYTGAPILFAQLLESMQAKFVGKLSKLGFSSCHRIAGTWKVTVDWTAPVTHEQTYAASLVQVMADKYKEQGQRTEVAMIWEAYEALLLDGAVDVLKQRCTRAAEAKKSQVTVSFDALTKDIPDFPKRVRRDSTYYVDEWSLGGVTAESWFYSNNGIATTYAGTPIIFAQLLDRLLAKFVQKASKMGFSSCRREAGTWKVTVDWTTTAKEERPIKRARHEDALVGGA